MMKSNQLLMAALAVAALGGVVNNASAKDLSASVDVVRSSVRGHAYQNGGIGVDEVHEMRTNAKPYNLHLTFSEGKQNAYVADVRLSIADASGTRVFGLNHAGPLTDVNLPAGKYQVVADFGGIKRGGLVDIKPGEAAALYLHWPKDQG